MSTEEVEKVHQDGPAWTIVGRFPTFDAADQKRLELAMEENLQVKVHWQGKVNNRYYAVKTRLDPAIALEEEAAARRAEKKRRKAKLNKKRRKK
tara:strand:- start:61371 stop:61652 length:282 start_codon:yes stop_codon:yes gene_type:complete